jgi:hypothetical protein
MYLSGNAFEYHFTGWHSIDTCPNAPFCRQRQPIHHLLDDNGPLGHFTTTVTHYVIFYSKEL